MTRWLVGVFTLLCLACGSYDNDETPALALADGETVHPTLLAHTSEFEQRVYHVTEGVHVAVGYALANSILVEGDECAFVVDTTGSIETAKTVRAEFEKITQKPIRSLIYTHNHADHVFGAPGFAETGKVEVYAHETTEYYINRVVSILREAISVRSGRMFGEYLAKEGPDRHVNAGIGASLEIGPDFGTLGLIRPTKTFKDTLDTVICGVRVHLQHAPGETNDQLFVWLPDKKVLMPGDNFYRAFPNLYTIRGTLYRDLMSWVESLDQMRALRPDFIVPSHTRPVSGADEIYELLTVYRDGIQYVHDQTIRGINLGLTPDELVEKVVLPPHLRNHPYLIEHYGTVEWSVRSVFTGYLGWFDGDSASLSPAPPIERARGYIALAGGADALITAGDTALKHEEFAWAAELATHLLRAEERVKDATRIKISALQALGRRSQSPNGRNYYLTQARELSGKTDLNAGLEISERVQAVVESVPIRNFITAMPSRLIAERALDTNMVVGFRFPDVDEGYTLHIRYGVAEFKSSFPEKPDLTITADADVWRQVVLRLRNPAMAVASGDLRISGGVGDLVTFLRLFEG